MNNEIKLHANSSVDDIAVDGLSLLDLLNVCNLAIAGLPRMCGGLRRMLAASQAAAKDEPTLLAGVKQTAQQFELAAAFAESEISIKH